MSASPCHEKQRSAFAPRAASFEFGFGRLIPLLLLVALVVPLRAATFTMIADGDISDGSKYSGAAAPGPSDDIEINEGVNATVLNDFTVNSIGLTGAAGTDGATLTILNGAVLTLNGGDLSGNAITIGSGGSSTPAVIDVQDGEIVALSGDVAVAGGGITASILMATAGTIRTDSIILFNANSQVDFSAGDAFLEVAGDFTGFGPFIAGTLSTVVFNGGALQTFDLQPTTTFANVVVNQSPVNAVQMESVITINGTLDIQTATMRIEDGFSAGVASTLQMGAGTKLQLGDSTITTPIGMPDFGSYALDAASTIAYDANVAQNVNFNVPYENLAFAGGAATPTKQFVGNTAIAGNMTVGTAVDVDLFAGVISVGGNVSGTGSLTGGGADLQIGGLFNHSGTWSAGTGTVTYTGIGSQNARAGAVTYHHLVIANTASCHFSGNTQVNGDFTVNDGAFPDLNGSTMTVAGNVVVNEALNDGLLVMTGTAVTLDGNGIPSGSAIFGAALSLGVSANVTIPSTASLNFLSNTFLNSSSTLTNNGTVDTDSSVNGTGQWINAAGSQLFVTGTIAAPLTATASANIVTYDGSLGQTVKGTTYHHLVLTNPGTTAKTPDGAIIVNGNLTMSGSNTTFNSVADVTVAGNVSLTNTTYDAIDDTITVGGNWSRSGGAFVPGTSMVVFNGTGAQSIAPTTFHNVTFDNGGIKTPTGDLAIEGHVTIADDAIVNAGSFFHSVRGNWTVATGGVFNAGTSTITFDGGGPQFIDATAFHHVTVVNTATTSSVSLNGDVTVAGNFSLLDGDFDLVTAMLDVDGGFLVAAGTNFIGNDGDIHLGGAVQTDGVMTSDAGTTYIDGAGVQNWTGLTVPSLGDVYLDRAGGSLNNAVPLDIDGILTLKGGAIVTSPGSSINILSTGSIQRDGLTQLGWIDGRINWTHTSTTAVYPFGTTAGYAPLALTIDGPGQIDIEIVDTAHPSATGGNSLGLFWRVHSPTTSGSPYTFDFAYPVGAVAGTESNYVIGFYNGAWSQPGGTVDDVNHTANLSTATLIGDWTIGEPASVGGVASFDITTDGSADAGTSETITIIAKDALGNTVSAYTGVHTLHFGGADPAPDGTTPKAYDNLGVPIAFGSDTDITFAAGSANVNLLLYEADSPTVTVEESPAGDPAGSFIISVNAAAPTELISTSINSGSPVYETVPFSLGIGSADDYGNLSNVSADTDIALTLTFGNGTLGGTLTGTIPANDFNVNLFGLTYDVAENITVDAARTGGDTLASTNVAFTVLPQVSTLTVMNAADSGTDSLRDILNRVNNGECAAPCNVSFAIPGTAPFTIAILTRLPDVLVPVSIDATTQPGYAGTPAIFIQGSALSGALELTGDGSLVRGLAFGDVNGTALLVSGNNSTVELSWFGINPAGVVPAANVTGLRVDGDNNTIQDNVISGNTTGLQFGGTATANSALRNRIGTDPAGTAAVPNTTGLILATSATSNVIGGSTPADGNLISGNSGVGISLAGTVIIVIDSTGGTAASSSGVPGEVTTTAGGVVELNVIQNNLIGVQIDGSSALGNDAGIHLANSAANNVIRWNTIAHNSVGIVASNSDGNVFTENAIHDNTGIGIDLGNNGVTPNDTGDPDTGANNLQNTPELASAVLDSFGNATVGYDVDSAAAGALSIRVELFRADSMISGEGMQFLSSQCTEQANFPTTATFAAGSLAAGNTVVGTATSYSDASCSTVLDGTSEFSGGASVSNCTAPTPTITASGPTTFCTGGNVTLTSSAADSYLWSNGATSQSIVVTTGGSYSVTTTTSGCNATSAATSITVNPAPTAVITAGGPTTFCDGDNVTLTASNGDSWLWSTGATSQSIVASASGSYSVTVTTSGCSTTSSPTNVTVNPAPIVTIAGPASMCDGGSVTLDAGAGFASYLWSTGATSQMITVSPASDTTYTVSVTDGNGCPGSDSHLVTVAPALTPAISGPASVCPGGSVTLDAGAGYVSYLWSTGATSRMITVSPASDTTYTVTVSDGSCSGNDSHMVTVATVSTPTITPGGPTTFCDGGSVTLTASAGDAYLWSTGATTQSITVSTGGSYDVEVTTGGCSATSAATTVTVTPNPAATITPDGPTTFCAGDDVTLTASNGDSWLWSTGATTQSIVVSTAGNYSVTVTTGGCSATSAATTVTVSAPPTATLTAPANACAGSSGNAASVNATAGATYNWSVTNGTITAGQGTDAIEFKAGSSGSVTLAVTVSVGSCSASDSATIVLAPSPVVSISAPSEAEESETLSASVASQAGVTYAWSIVNGTILGGAATNAISFQTGTSGQTELFVTATLGGCSKTDNHAVQIASDEPVLADLALTKTAPSSIDAGATFTYTLAVRNHGPSAAQILLEDPMPAGVVVTGIQEGALDCDVFGSVVSCVGPLTSGKQTLVTISVTAPTSGGTITNTATTSSAISDPDPANNSASATTLVNPAQAGCPTVAPVPTSPVSGSVSSPVTFSWTPSDVPVSYEVWAVVNGVPSLLGTTASTSLTRPLSAGPIEWYVIARGDDDCTALESGRAAATIEEGFNCDTPIAPQIATPAEGAVVSAVVTISWTATPGAIGYRVWAEINDTAAQNLGETDGATSLTVTLPAGSATVFVEALFSGCLPVRSTGTSFRVVPPDPCAGRTQAFPAAPSNAAVLDSSSMTFDWNPANEPDGYRVWFVRNGGTPEVIGTTVDDTSFEASLQSGVYEWWVEALYDGCASTESEHRTFSIPERSGCAGLSAQLLEPANNASLSDALVDFHWTEVPSAVRYEVWLSVGRGTPTLVGQSDTTSLTTDVADGDIEWMVRAIADRCPSIDTQASRFTLRSPDACAANRRPTTLAPVNRSLAESPVDFSWTAVDGATSYEVFVSHGSAAAVSLGSTPNTHLDDVDLANGNVRWFVRAHFGNCIPLDSAEQKFEVVPSSAACGLLAAPVISAVAQVSSDIPFLIQWSDTPGATSYQLQIATSSQFNSAQTFTTQDASQSLIRSNDSGAAAPIFARVRAIDSRCPRSNVSPFSSTAAIYVLPIEGSEGATPDGNEEVTHTIVLGPELAGQFFTVSLKEPWLVAHPSSGEVGPLGTSIAIVADTAGLQFGSSLASVVVTLTTPDSSGISTHATTTTKPTTISFSKITPVSPTPKSTPPPDALIIPAVAHANGFNSQFQSDVRVTNSSAKLINYQLTFIPSGMTGIATGRQTNFAIEAGKTVALDDVLRTWFGTGSESVTGTLEIRPLTQTATATSDAAFSGLANLVTFASSRTFNATANGTFGQHIPAIPYANFLGATLPGAAPKVLSLQQIAQSDEYRTNLGIVEGSGEPVSLLVKVFGSTGQKLTEFPVTLAGGQHTQLNSFLAERGITSLSDGRVELSVTSPAGKITAYASVLDNETNDPLLVTPVSLSDEGATRWVVPGVADLANGVANWQTDMRIFNADATDVDVTLSFHSQNGGTPRTATMTIPAGQVRQLDSTLASVFGATNDGGAVHIETADAARLITTARTYNQTTDGTFGQFISGVTIAEAAGVGSRPLQLLQVEETNRFRTNVGIAEVTGNPVLVEVAVVPPDSKFTTVTVVPLAANEFRQLSSILRSVGLADTYNARVTVRAITGTGRVTAYASVIDSVTQDPTYIPAQ